MCFLFHDMNHLLWEQSVRVEYISRVECLGTVEATIGLGGCVVRCYGSHGHSRVAGHRI